MSHHCLVTELQRCPVLQKRVDKVMDESLGGNLEPAESIIEHIIEIQVTILTVHIVTTLCLKKGMDRFVLAMYRHIAATFAIAPFALILERSVLDQNLYYICGLEGHFCNIYQQTHF
ncbi:hypothetical protein Dimus_015670 [Dionaea muscipula]